MPAWSAERRPGPQTAFPSGVVASNLPNGALWGTPRGLGRYNPSGAECASTVYGGVPVHMVGRSTTLQYEQRELPRASNKTVKTKAGYLARRVIPAAVREGLR